MLLADVVVDCDGFSQVTTEGTGETRADGRVPSK
jgi:hypothetical protein